MELYPVADKPHNVKGSMKGVELVSLPLFTVTGLLRNGRYGRFGRLEENVEAVDAFDE